MPRAVEAKDPADALARGLELLDRAARDEASRARAAGKPYRGRVPAIVAGSRRSFDVLDVPTRKGSAGIGIDATEAESHARRAASAWSTPIAARSTSWRPASPSSAPTSA